jgi:hypothetical protein
MVFRQQARTCILGKLRGSLACKPNTPHVRVFHHGDSDAATQGIARVACAVLGLDFSAGLTVAGNFRGAKVARTSGQEQVEGKAFAPEWRDGGQEPNVSNSAVP